MSLGEILSGAGSVLNAGANIGGTIVNYKNAEKQYELQKENLAYQKQLQQQIFQREDTAVERRVRDLENVGLSKVLATGQSAGSGAAIQTNAPETPRIGKFDFAQLIMGLAKMKQDISTSESQEELNKMQQMKSKAGTLKNLEETKTEITKRAGIEKDNAIKAHDLKIIKNTGTSSRPSKYGKIFNDIFGFSNSVYEKLPRRNVRGVQKNSNVAPEQKSRSVYDIINRKAGKQLYRR